MTSVRAPQQRFGTGVPSSSLGFNGDSYLDLASGNAYTKSAGAWTSPGALLTTPVSTYAPAGLTHYGTGLPAAMTGNINDYYIDEATGNIYGPKAATGVVTFRAAATAGYGGNATTAALVIPASTQSGDLLVMVISDSATTSTPAGWTSQTAIAIGSSTYFYVFTKTATSTDASSTAFTCTTTYQSAAVVAYSNSTGLVVGATTTGTTQSTIADTAIGGTTTSSDVVLHLSGLFDSVQDAEQYASASAGTVRAVGYGNASGVAVVETDGSSASVTTTYSATLGGATHPVTGIGAVQLQINGTASAWTVIRTIGTPAWTASKTAAYTASPGDGVLCDTTSATFAVTLPLDPAPNAPVRVKWIAGAAAPTVAAASGATPTETLDPKWTSFVNVGDSVDFSFDATTGVWEVV